MICCSPYRIDSSSSDTKSRYTDTTINDHSSSDLAFQKGLSLRVRINIKFVRIFYAIKLYSQTISTLSPYLLLVKWCIHKMVKNKRQAAMMSYLTASWCLKSLWLEEEK